MTTSFPRQYARTRRFTLGVPRAFDIAPDGGRIAYLRTKNGTDPSTCLWLLDLVTGTEHLVADPAALAVDGADEDLSPEEKARRERSREQAGGIVAYATDADLRIAAFGLSGRVFVADLSAVMESARADVRELPARRPAIDPRPDPTGQRVAYVSDGALRVIDIATGDDRSVAEPDADSRITFGLAEFIAAEEMDRTRGYWWAPDGGSLLAARVDVSPVQRWHIADPANPDQPINEVAYPAAGTANADVTLVVAGLDGAHTEVAWDHAGFPYLVNAYWRNADLLIVVQSRDQREMRILRVDPPSGATTVVRTDNDPSWLEIVTGIPARTASGGLVWTADSRNSRRLLIAGPDNPDDPAPVTPPGLQVRAVLDVDGDTVLFSGSEEPTEIHLWTYGPDGLNRITEGPGVFNGRRAGGTTVVSGQGIDHDGVVVRVLRESDRPGAVGAGGEVARIESRAEQPELAVSRVEPLAAGNRRIRTVVLMPSWYEHGSGRLPVLLDPYGGPGAQRVLATRSAYQVSQWLADQGFAVVIADGRGTPGRGPEWERAVQGDLAGPVLEDQIEALNAAAQRFADLDLGRVGIMGWSFGGYLSALAVLRRPDVFHAAVAGAPVTEWRLYDTHYTERYLGHPDEQAEVYERCSLLSDAHRLSRPLLLIHGFADDNVVVAHTLRLSSALLASGRPHSVLPLSGVNHIARPEATTENLLLLQINFFRNALGVPAPPES